MNMTALVPMRHDSHRVPGKNYRIMAGKPLYHHILSTLGKCPELAEVVVDTDSREIIHGVRENFPSVRLLERPDRLRGGEVSMNEVLIHDATIVDSDFYLQTHSTNPLLRHETISAAIQTFLQNYPEHDSLFSVTRVQTRLWDAEGRAINHDPSNLIRTQDLPPLFEENSCIYIFSRQSLLSRRNRIGERPLLYEIDTLEAWDIDEEQDFLIVDLIKSGILKRHTA